MKKIVCEMCEGTEFAKVDGMFVCQNCGTKYSPEEAKSLMVEVEDVAQDAVKVENTATVEKLHTYYEIIEPTFGNLYENESIAIVGESGSGKSVFTKTFAGMLETNGFISEGELIYNDEELASTKVELKPSDKRRIKSTWETLDNYSKLEHGADIYKKIVALKDANKARYELTDEENVFALPDRADEFSCILQVTALQLLSYYTALERGCDIDKPRNLAKSVTVE